MEKRKQLIVNNTYKVINILLDLSFCKAYQILGLVDNKSYYLIDYDQKNNSFLLNEEMRLWTDSKEYPFPQITDSWEEDNVLSVVLPQFQGTSLSHLLRMSATPLLEEKIFSFMPELKNIFESLYDLRIAIKDTHGIAERIFYSIDGKIRVVPTLLYYIFERKDELPNPFVRDIQETPATSYIKTWGGGPLLSPHAKLSD